MKPTCEMCGEAFAEFVVEFKNLGLYLCPACASAAEFECPTCNEEFRCHEAEVRRWGAGFLVCCPKCGRELAPSAFGLEHAKRLEEKE